MKNLDSQIIDIAETINSTIKKADDLGAGLTSQCILAQLRNLVEHVDLKMFSGGGQLEDSYENLEKAVNYVKARGELRFLAEFHDCLQITASHYTPDQNSSERLMLKYLDYLYQMRALLHGYGVECLKDLEQFPTNDLELDDYYKQIAAAVSSCAHGEESQWQSDQYYVEKIKPFFVGGSVYYEITLTVAGDRPAKTDRTIVFTSHRVLENYAIRIKLADNSIPILGKKMPILIITDWEVSVRPCELTNYSKIFDINYKISRKEASYKQLMSLLTDGMLSITDLVCLPPQYFQDKLQLLRKSPGSQPLVDTIDKTREIIESNAAGSNVLRYLTWKMRNRVIKDQLADEGCRYLSHLRLAFGCIPFDTMPFCTSLVRHNPTMHDLLRCISPNAREYEFLANEIKQNTEIQGQIFTQRDDLSGYSDVDALITEYNEKLYHKHVKKRSIESLHDFLYIKEYADDAHAVLEKLEMLSEHGLNGYTGLVNNWIEHSGKFIDDTYKLDALRKLYDESSVALIYGSAGTGKTTFTSQVAELFSEERKIFLAQTNSAVENLRRRVSAKNSQFMTITKFLGEDVPAKPWGLLVIDECSFVSNSDMQKILNRNPARLYLLTGDEYQIESIEFGNWFYIAHEQAAIHSITLDKMWRSKDAHLKQLWDRVRELDPHILESITKGDFSHSLDESLFEPASDDEVILCLNYDGLYGINNINTFLQNANHGQSFERGTKTYKVGDPVLFKDTDRFSPYLHNNTKGKIHSIKVQADSVAFDIELYQPLTEFDASRMDLVLLGQLPNDHSIVRILVFRRDDSLDDLDLESSAKTVVPFQVSYAISIHKAQGLEYDSVKVVISDEIDEMVTHNIFYTAITRAKENLKIYWTPRTEQKVLANLSHRDIKRDMHLLSQLEE